MLFCCPVLADPLAMQRITSSRRATTKLLRPASSPAAPKPTKSSSRVSSRATSSTTTKAGSSGSTLFRVRPVLPPAFCSTFLTFYLPCCRDYLPWISSWVDHDKPALQRAHAARERVEFAGAVRVRAGAHYEAPRGGVGPQGLLPLAQGYVYFILYTYLLS